MAATKVNITLTIPSLTTWSLWLYPQYGGALLNAGGDLLTVIDGDASGLNYEATVDDAVVGTVQGHAGPSAAVVGAGPFEITMADDTGTYRPAGSGTVHLTTETTHIESES